MATTYFDMQVLYQRNVLEILLAKSSLITFFPMCKNLADDSISTKILCITSCKYDTFLSDTIHIMIIITWATTKNWRCPFSIWKLSTFWTVILMSNFKLVTVKSERSRNISNRMDILCTDTISHFPDSFPNSEIFEILLTKWLIVFFEHVSISVIVIPTCLS